MLGGAKVSDKLAVIANLIKIADTLVIGGGMAFTFLASEGYEVGKSLLEADQIKAVQRYLNDAASGGKQIVLPSDIVVAPEVSADAEPTVVAADAMPPDQVGLDIGPDSARVFAGVIRHAKTVFWNGPMGVAEWETPATRGAPLPAVTARVSPATSAHSASHSSTVEPASSIRPVSDVIWPGYSASVSG